MWFIDRIFSLVWDISDFFYDAWLEVKGWMWPLNQLAPRLLAIGDAFWDLLTPIAQVSDWAYDVQQKVADILSFDNIWSYFHDWFVAAANAWDWVLDAWWIVTNWIDDWWSGASLTVQGWIAIATQGFNDMVVAWGNFWNVTWPQWTGKLDILRGEWDNFWTVTYPNLVSFEWLTTWWNERLPEVNTLINSAILIWFPFYDSLAELWGSVAEFITNPFDWLENRLADWFLGPEE